MKIKALITGVAGSFAISTAALAADPIFIPPPAPPPIVVAPVGFDWSGPYVGAGIAFGGGDFGFGGQAGFNLVPGNLLVGGELWAVYVPGIGGGVLVVIAGKAGFLLGPTDRALLYGTFGAGFQIGAGFSGFAAGPGVALALGDRVSVFGEALVTFGIGPVDCCVFRGGVNFHFGN